MTSLPELVFRESDLEHPAVAALVRAHRDDLARLSPPGSVHAFTPDAFADPAVTLLTAWKEDVLVGCGALKRHGGRHAGLGELKTMRTAARFLRRGAGAAVLERLIGLARRDGLTRLALETGATEPFAPALALYARYGFRPCEPFADYEPDPFSVFLARDLQGPSSTET